MLLEFYTKMIILPLSTAFQDKKIVDYGNVLFTEVFQLINANKSKDHQWLPKP